MRVRADAYAAATQALIGEIRTPFDLRSIESRALRVWRTEWVPRYTDARDIGEWNWDALSSDYLRRPAAFHLAIWSEGRLCGMAAGKASGKHRILTVNFIEGSPDPHHPLKGKIRTLALAAAKSYAQVLGATTLRLSDPAPELLAGYVAAGFDLVFLGRAVRYCERRIG